MNVLLLSLPIRILLLITSIASLIAVSYRKTSDHHNQIPRLHISTDSVYRLMARSQFDKVDTIRDSIHPVNINYMGFTNASMPVAKKMKGYAFFSFDNRGNDTAFVWAYVANQNANRGLERGDLEAGIDGFNKLVSSVREEYGAPSDSLIVGTVSKDILVQWKYGGTIPRCYIVLINFIRVWISNVIFPSGHCQSQIRTHKIQNTRILKNKKGMCYNQPYTNKSC
jgi:hypothetical protein